MVAMINPYNYLSITNNVPFAQSCSVNDCRGGSRVTRTLSSLWRRTGGMSLKDAGVDPTIFLCSSAETYCGTDDINVVETITKVSVDASNSRTLEALIDLKSETAAYLI